MTISRDQISTLLNLVVGTSQDSLDCDGCLDHVSQFVETQLEGLNLCESMNAVKQHLENCPCCQDEFEALLRAMKEVDGCSDRQTPPPA